MRRVRLALLGALALASGLAACEPGPPKAPEIRLWTDTYEYIVSSDPAPPRARERATYKVVVLDKESRQPIEGGEGQIFATSRDGKNAWDSFTRGPQLGTYYANMNYLTSGDWALAIRFRRDSTRPLERADWMQTIRPGKDNF